MKRTPKKNHQGLVVYPLSTFARNYFLLLMLALFEWKNSCCKLESQSRNKNVFANLEFPTSHTELQTEKAATGYKTIAEFTE